LLKLALIVVKAQYRIENKESEVGENEGEEETDVENTASWECAIVSAQAVVFVKEMKKFLVVWCDKLVRVVSYGEATRLRQMAGVCKNGYNRIS
jgi:hypothetical protein